jgi:hypothetical protein
MLFELPGNGAFQSRNDSMTTNRIQIVVRAEKWKPFAGAFINQELHRAYD